MMSPEPTLMAFSVPHSRLTRLAVWFSFCLGIVHIYEYRHITPVGDYDQPRHILGTSAVGFLGAYSFSRPATQIERFVDSFSGSDYFAIHQGCHYRDYGVQRSHPIRL